MLGKRRSMHASTLIHKKMLIQSGLEFMLTDFFKIFVHYSLDIIPVFLVAILISAIISESIPERVFERFLGTSAFFSVFISSLIGAAVPLCTCGMIPLANKLQKKGASWPIAIAFLTSGNSCSISALVLTLILGLKVTIFRFLFAVISAILISYLFVLVFKPTTSTYEAKVDFEIGEPFVRRVIKEFLSLLVGFGIWTIISIFIAAFIDLFSNTQLITNLISKENLFSPFLFSIIGFPFYFCAGSDIPLSKVLLEKGISLGSVLSFMNASPGVNVASFLIYQKWLGLKKSVGYMFVSFLVYGFLGVVFNLLK